MDSPVVTPKKKTCVMCHEEKGRTTFIKNGDMCTKCRNTETNPVCLKRGQPPIWTSVSPQRGSPNRLSSVSQSSSSIVNNSSFLQHSNSRLTNSSQLEEKNTVVTPNISGKTLEHKIDLILESTLEMERSQVQIASIRSEIHKFLVDLSYLNNVPSDEEQKYSGLDSLAATMEQRFVSTRNNIAALQGTVSTLRSEIASMIDQHSKAIEDTWRVETERREQIWQDRLIEERRVWNERLMEERKQWQQYMQQQTFQLHQILQANMKQLRQEYHTAPRTENLSSETSRVLNPSMSNTNLRIVHSPGSSKRSVSQSTVPVLEVVSAEMSRLSIGASTSLAPVISSNSRSSIKPPRISIKGTVVLN